jgi:hypothetical protein
MFTKGLDQSNGVHKQLGNVTGAEWSDVSSAESNTAFADN